MAQNLKGFYDGDGGRYELPEPYDDSKLRGLISGMASQIEALIAEVNRLNNLLSDKVSSTDLKTALDSKVSCETLTSAPCFCHIVASVVNSLAMQRACM